MKHPFLNEAQIQSYQSDGFLIIKNFLKDEMIAPLKKRMTQIVDAFHPSELKVFTTENQNQHMDAYFLESAERVHCFFEEDAIDKAGNMSVPKAQAINKIGHAMHDLLPEFEQAAYTENLYSIAQSLGLHRPAIVQSQYIFKQPKIGGKVNPHVDSTFIYTDPHSCLGAWIALEDADEENGCLTAIAGSHKLPLHQRFIRNKSNTGTEFATLIKDPPHWDLKKMQALPVKKGDLVLLHGQVVHASYANHSERSRHAFVLHLIDLDCSWPKDNWLQRSKKLPFRAMESVVYHRFS